MKQCYLRLGLLLAASTTRTSAAPAPAPAPTPSPAITVGSPGIRYDAGDGFGSGTGKNVAVDDITATKLLVCYSLIQSGSASGVCSIVPVDGASTTAGTPVEFSSKDVGYIAVTVQNTAFAIVCYTDVSKSDSPGECSALSISGMTLAVIGSKVNLGADEKDGELVSAVQRLTDTTAVVCWYGDAAASFVGFKGLKCQVLFEDSSILNAVDDVKDIATVDANFVGCALSLVEANKVIACYGLPDSGKCVILSFSGTTTSIAIAVGSEFAFQDCFLCGAFTDFEPVTEVGVATLTTTIAVVCYTVFESSPASQGVCKLLTISGTSITPSPDAASEGTSYFTPPPSPPDALRRPLANNVAKLSETEAIVCYMDSEEVIDATSTIDCAIQTDNNDQCLFFYYDGSCELLTVSGTTISVGSPAAFYAPLSPLAIDMGIVPPNLNGAQLSSLGDSGIAATCFPKTGECYRLLSPGVVASITGDPPEPGAGGDPYTQYNGTKVRFWFHNSTPTTLINQPLGIEIYGRGSPPAGKGKALRGDWMVEIGVHVDKETVVKATLAPVEPLLMDLLPKPLLEAARVAGFLPESNRRLEEIDAVETDIEASMNGIHDEVLDAMRHGPPAAKLSTLRLEVNGAAVSATGTHDGTTAAGMPVQVLVWQLPNKHIGSGHVEGATIKIGDMFEVMLFTAKAHKFESEAEKIAFMHLDFKILKWDEAKATGPLPEMWGLKPMSAATKAMLSPH